MLNARAVVALILLSVWLVGGCVVEGPSYHYYAANLRAVDVLVRVNDRDVTWYRVPAMTWGPLVENGGAVQAGWNLTVFDVACRPQTNLAMTNENASVIVGGNILLVEGFTAAAGYDIPRKQAVKLATSPCPGS